MVISNKVKMYVMLIITAIISIGLLYMFSPAASAARGEMSLTEHFKQTNITSVGTCTPDSDGDGYASCSYKLDQVVSLQCVSDIMVYVPLFGSKSCKMQTNEVIKLK